MNNTSILPKIGIGIIIFLILGYVLFRFLPIVIGPEISVVTPEGYLVTQEDFVDITLETQRVTELHIQELPVDVQKSGTTMYRYQLSEGINRISITAVDAYDSSKKTSILVMKKSGKPL